MFSLTVTGIPDTEGIFGNLRIICVTPKGLERGTNLGGSKNQMTTGSGNIFAVGLGFEVHDLNSIRNARGFINRVTKCGLRAFDEVSPLSPDAIQKIAFHKPTCHGLGKIQNLFLRRILYSSDSTLCPLPLV